MRQAMIFAAGLGTRLRPLTDDRPKALVTAGGRTLLEIVLERLAAAGFEHVVVNVHHFGEQIIEWLTTHPTPMPVVVSDERQMLLDTGGGLRAARRLFADAPVLIHNVDIMSDAPLTKLYDEACSSGHTTLLTSDRSTSRYLLADEQSRLVGWTNIQTGEVRSEHEWVKQEMAEGGGQALRRCAFSGIHVITPELLAEMEGWPERFSIIDFYLRMCARHAVMLHHAKQLRLLDVGKPEALARAAEFCRE